MATFPPTMIGLTKFQNEFLRLFPKTDIYLRLEVFELVGYQPTFAAAPVVQVISPTDLTNIRLFE